MLSKVKVISSTCSKILDISVEVGSCWPSTENAWAVTVIASIIPSSLPPTVLKVIL